MTQRKVVGNTGTNARRNVSGNVLNAGGTAVSGCLASWFTATAGTPSVPFGQSISPNGTATVNVTVALTNATANQDSCQGISGPKIELDVNSG